MHPRLLDLLACALPLLVLAGGCTCSSLPGRGALRPAEFAGAWYPEDEEELKKVLDGALAAAAPAGHPVRAIVVPHAGLKYAGRIAGKGWGAVQGRSYDRVVLLAQAHTRRYAGAFLAAEGGYQTPLGPLLVDEDATAQLERFPLLKRRAVPFDDENSVELLLPWIARLWPQARVVPVLVGRVDDAGLSQLAEALRSVLDERTLLAVSSDFAHSGDRFGHRLVPRGITGAAAEATFLEAQGRALDALRVADEAALVQRDHDGKLHLCSRDVLRLLTRLVGPNAVAVVTAAGSSMEVDFSQDDGEAVGYASLSFGGRWPSVPALGPAAREALARIARQSLEAAAAGREPPRESDVPPRLAAPGGAFVTLYNDRGELRASSGRLVDERIADAMRGAAAMAVREDPLVPPITPEELPRLEAELSVLGPLVPLQDPLDFEPGRHGLLLRSGDASGLLLPQVALQNGLDREGFLRALAERAGLEPDGWQGAALERFGVETFPMPGAPPLGAELETAPR